MRRARGAADAWVGAAIIKEVGCRTHRVEPVLDDSAAGDGAVLGHAGVEEKARNARERVEHPRLRSSRVGTRV